SGVGRSRSAGGGSHSRRNASRALVSGIARHQVLKIRRRVAKLCLRSDESSTVAPIGSRQKSKILQGANKPQGAPPSTTKGYLLAIVDVTGPSVHHLGHTRSLSYRYFMSRAVDSTSAASSAPPPSGRSSSQSSDRS